MAKSSTSGMGRPKGTPNKATMAAREAIATFVDGNAHRLQSWLDGVANGVSSPITDKSGQPVKDENGKIVTEFIVNPNPERAFNLFQSVIEYHIPKLARTEHSGGTENTMTVRIIE